VTDLHRYARLHRLPLHLAALVALAGCQLWLGATAISVPSAHVGGDSSVQLRMLAALAGAALTVGSLHSPMATQEAAASHTHRRYERAHLLVAGAAVSTALCGAEFLTRSPESALTLLRALLIWTGLALLSARLLGRQQAWILPLATLFPLTYLGWDGVGTVHWWNWIWIPAGAPACWALAALSLAVGAVAGWATSWRLRRRGGGPG
jgi:hypothetical protein